jgi:hypothetical protein
MIPGEMRILVAALVLGAACHDQTTATEPARKPAPTPAAAPAEVAAITPPAAPPDAAPAPPPAPPAPTTVTQLAPGGIEETCQLLVAFPFTPDDVKVDPGQMRWYRKDDFEEIQELCAMSLYETQSTDSVTAVGICPKTHWSTPALEVHAIDKAGLDKTYFEKNRCARDRRVRGAKKVAKLKVPVYGKEPESSLMYFHLSRLLGADPYIVPVTYRTISRKELRRWTQLALQTLHGRELPRLNPLEGWSVLYYRHKKGDGVVGGAFFENARGEQYYDPFTYINKRAEQRISYVQQFRSRPYYKVVASKRAVADQLTFDPGKPKEFDRTLQALATAQDFTHMMILDHLFNQRDRSGNINSRVRYHYLDGDHLRWKKEPKSDDERAKMVGLDRLLLKDNDDGLRWDRFGLLNATLIIDEIRHVDTITYARLQWLAGLMSDPTTNDKVKAYFIDDVHVSEKSYDDIRARVIDLAARFERKHAAGELMVDLDLEPALAQRPLADVPPSVATQAGGH